MPKNPPDLPRLLPSANPSDRVQVQQTTFSYDVIGRYVCNDWGEVAASLADGGFPFDVVVVGAGMYGGYCAEKLYRLGAALGLRILVLDAGRWSMTKAQGVVTELPRSTRLGPGKGVWHRLPVDTENLRVHRRFFKDIETADFTLQLS